jgi:hypothetical protein
VDQTQLGQEGLLSDRRDESIQCRANPIKPRLGFVSRRPDRVENSTEGFLEGVFQAVRQAPE